MCLFVLIDALVGVVLVKSDLNVSGEFENETHGTSMRGHFSEMTFTISSHWLVVFVFLKPMQMAVRMPEDPISCAMDSDVIFNGHNGTERIAQSTGRC